MPTVVISGASAGVGRAVVRRFARPGTRIGLIARNRARLETTAAEVRQAGGEALVLPLDVADAAEVERAAETVEARLGPIDIWVNVAMVTVMSPVDRMTPEEFRRVTEVTYLGTVHGTLAALKRMKPRDRGAIVQVGSALAYRSVPLQSAYCAAKSAMVGFSDSLRSELIHDRSGVKLTVVHLPAVNTPQFDWARNKLGKRARPVPPVFQPEVIAEAIHHAAFHPRREYWLGFSATKAILSEKFLPGLGDRILARAGYDGQIEDAPEIPGRPDNLFDSVDGDYAARGRFGRRAAGQSPAIWASEHRDTVLGLAALAGLGLVAGLLSARRRRPLPRRTGLRPRAAR